MRASETRRTKARHVEYAVAPEYREDMGAIGGLCGVDRTKVGMAIWQGATDEAQLRITRITLGAWALVGDVK